MQLGKREREARVRNNNNRKPTKNLREDMPMAGDAGQCHMAVCPERRSGLGEQPAVSATSHPSGHRIPFSPLLGHRKQGDVFWAKGMPGSEQHEEGREGSWGEKWIVSSFPPVPNFS